jgi:MFS superfamily sulfate permease-like transporter
VVRFLAPLPLPALAGVVLVAAIDLIDVRRLREFQRFRPADFWTAICSAAAVVWLGMIRGIAVGVAVALAEALRRSMHPDRLLLSDRLRPDRYYEPFSSQAVQAADGVVVYRFGAPLFFGSVPGRHAAHRRRGGRQAAHGGDQRRRPGHPGRDRPRDPAAGPA